MKILSGCYCLLLVLAFSVRSYSQTSRAYPKTLLWRISGNGLKEPSYLFGTMHLNDKRLFRFDDSVYAAIEKTDGLAIEVNPEEMAAFYIENLVGEMEKGKKLSDILTAKDLKKYGTALTKKIGKPVSEITARDILKEKNKWVAEYMKKGEMPTFLDAYLYNLAHKQGKWVGGIEDIADQANILDDIIDKSDVWDILREDTKEQTEDGLEKMISLYTSQNIDSITLISDIQSQEKKDILLIKRNIKMARRMDSLSSVRNMFFAVGVAHLPGDSGVISLLQKRGFAVEPVISHKKIEPESYKVKEVPVSWNEISGSQDQYKISMPGNPASFKMYGLIDCKFYFDIFNYSGYLTMGVPSAMNNGSQDSLFNTIAESVFKGAPFTMKKIEKNGMQGREITGETDVSMRMQIFAGRKLFIMNMMVALKKDRIKSPDAEKFLSSFAISKSQPVNIAYHLFEDSIMGARMITPAKLEPSKSLGAKSNESWKVTGYAGVENTTGSYVVLFSKEVQPRYYIMSDSAINADLLTNLKKQYGNVSTSIQILNGTKATHYRGSSALQKGIYLHALSYIKDNRNIVIMAIGDSLTLNQSLLDTVFRSFSAITPPVVRWSQQSIGNSFSTYAPSAFHAYEPDESFSTSQIVAYDTTTATSFFVIQDTLNKYAWYDSLPAYWRKLKTDYVHAPDSLLSVARVKNGALEALDIQLLQHDNYDRLKHVRYVLNGKELYKLVVSAGRDYISNENVSRFFNDFRLMVQDSSSWITESKVPVIIKDLSSADSSVCIEARSALNKLSIDLKKRLFPQLIPFAKESIPGPSIARICNNLLDSGMLKMEDIAAWQEDFITLTDRLAPYYYAKGYDHFDTNIYSLVTLLGRYETPASLAALRKLLQARSVYLKKAVALELIRRKKPVEAGVLASIASDKEERVALYNDLKELKKQALFPAKFATQAQLAESLVYTACSDQDIEPDQVKFIDKRIAAYKGSKFNFYLYKVVLGTGADKEEYLGIAGPYKLNSVALIPEEDVSAIYMTKQLSGSNVAALLNSYLKSKDKEME